MSDLANVIKQIAIDAGEARKPNKLIKGRVMNCHRLNPSYNPQFPPSEANPRVIPVPIEIQVSDKLFFREGDGYMILTGYMRKCLDSYSELHFHPGDSVYLIRVDEGDKYLLLDVIR